jgi:hypothetical protein
MTKLRLTGFDLPLSYTATAIICRTIAPTIWTALGRNDGELSRVF